MPIMLDSLLPDVGLFWLWLGIVGGVMGYVIWTTLERLDRM